MKKNVLYTVILVLALGLYSSAFAQMNYWTTPPYKFNMNSTTPFRSTLPGIVSPLEPYGVANGAYDQNGNLLFYIKGDKVYGPTGYTPIGKLGGYNVADCIYRFTTISSEIAIVPIPGSCKQFYIIYGMSNFQDGFVLLYCKVDCSGASPVIINNSTVEVSCPPDYTHSREPEGFFISYGSYLHTALAVSKIYTGSGSTAKRFLFATGRTTYDQGVIRCVISNTGISSPTQVVTSKTLGFSDGDFESWEAELSWGSNKFAWIDLYNSDIVHVIGINSYGLWDGIIQNYSVPGAVGIEFNNSTSPYPLLYVSGTNGIKKINTQTQTMTSVTLPAGINLSHTFLEYGKNNKIYGISPTYDAISGDLTATTLVGIASNDAVTTVDAGFNSLYTFLDDVFTLPDQIDGDDYNQFNGNPRVTLTGFTLNNGIPSTNCSSVTNYFNCNPINFTPIYTGGIPTRYKFEIKATDATCNLLTGSGYINYNPGGLTWTTGQPAANLDLRTLTDAAGLDLGNISGRVNVKYTISDACNFETTKNYTIMVSSAPQPNIVLEILNSSNNQTYQAPSHNIAIPVNVGTYTIGYRINNSTGLITYYRAVIDEVTSSGTFIKNIYDRTINISGASGLTYEGLNSYCVSNLVWPVNPGFGNCTTGIPDDDSPSSVSGYNGYTGYFGYNNGLYSYHRYFKLTVTIGNECSSSTDSSYLYVNERNKSFGAGVNNEITFTDFSIENSLSVYPNPSSDFITFIINSQKEDQFTLELTDMYGRKAMLFMENVFLPAGTSKRSYNISALPTGVYVYCLKTTTSAFKGLFTKN